MVEISLSGSGEGPGWVTSRGYSTAGFRAIAQVVLLRPRSGVTSTHLCFRLIFAPRGELIFAPRGGASCTPSRSPASPSRAHYHRERNDQAIENRLIKPGDRPASTITSAGAETGGASSKC